jgi:Lytic transglycolase
VNNSTLCQIFYVVALVAVSCSEAGAQDAWLPAYVEPTGPTTPRIPPVGTKSDTVPFVPKGWRTFIVPAPVEIQTLSALQQDAGPQEKLKSSPNALTGYAHELGGIASYYWQDQMTSSGERFDRRALTAAHKTLPIGTRVRVTNMANGRSIVVRINDRGPFKPGRVIDLSEAAAEQISMTHLGLVRVALDVVR